MTRIVRMMGIATISLALALTSSASYAQAEFGNCVKPTTPAAATRITGDASADGKRQVARAFAMQATDYGRCLLDYAEQNKDSLSNEEKAAVDLKVQELIAELRAYSIQWNQVYTDYLKESAKDEKNKAAKPN